PALDAVGAGQQLVAHVATEAYSVLTRLPTPIRIDPAQVAGLLRDAFPNPLLVLPPDEHRSLLSSCAAAGIRGGAVYDALIGATAAHAGESLLTLDARALRTYQQVGAE